MDKTIDANKKDENPKEEVSLDTVSEDEGVDEGVYEVGYILIPTIEESKLALEVSKLKKIIEENSKAFISEEFPSMKELSYEMVKHVLGKNQKFNEGYFGWVKFEAPKDKIEQIKDALFHLESILRFLIVKTVKENTMTKGRSRMMKKPTDSPKDQTIISSPHSEETPSDLTEEEMDKEISKTLENLEV